MSPDQIETLKQQFTGQWVLADAQRPELARWAGVRGVVKTINCNGQALVQFEGPDQAWHDLDLSCLRIAPPLEAHTEATEAKKGAGTE